MWRVKVRGVEGEGVEGEGEGVEGEIVGGKRCEGWGVWFRSTVLICGAGK